MCIYIYICVCGCRKPPAPPKKNDKEHYLSRILQWPDMCMDLLPVSHSLLWKAMAPLVRWFIFWKVVIFHSNVQLPEGVIVHHIYTYNIYIYLGTQKPVFFPSFGVDTFFFVITALLVRLKTRSEEPKYGLLTRAKSKKTFGFVLGFYQYFSEFFWWILWANFGPKSIKLTCFFHQMLLIFSKDETGTYPLLTIFFSQYGKKHEDGNSTIKTYHY